MSFKSKFADYPIKLKLTTYNTHIYIINNIIVIFLYFNSLTYLLVFMSFRELTDQM